MTLCMWFTKRPNCVVNLFYLCYEIVVPVAKFFLPISQEEILFQEKVPLLYFCGKQAGLKRPYHSFKSLIFP